MSSLYKATYGIILFAVPHRGLVLDDIQKMLAMDGEHPRRALLEQIGRMSDLLASQLTDFKNITGDKKIVSFYEILQTRQLEFVWWHYDAFKEEFADVLQNHEVGGWARTGDFVTTVDPGSALLQLPDYLEEKIPLHADHSAIVKFDMRAAPGYRSVADRLRQFELEAPDIIASRFLTTEIPEPVTSVRVTNRFTGSDNQGLQISQNTGTNNFYNSSGQMGTPPEVFNE
jgi:hypothetical protein